MIRNMRNIFEEIAKEGCNRTRRMDWREEIAYEMAKRDPWPIKEDIVSFLKKCLSSIEEKSQVDNACIRGNIHKLRGEKKIFEWKRDNENNKQNIVFLTFSKSGHVVVVGAGADLGFPDVSKKRYKTTSIMAWLEENKKEDWKDGKSPWEWNKEEAVGVVFEGLDGRFRTTIKSEHNNILWCRDGVECFIGEYLLANQIPILNALSHRNWSQEYWEDCISKKYIIM